MVDTNLAAARQRDLRQQTQPAASALELSMTACAPMVMLGY
jgi:hypothetical protein